MSVALARHTQQRQVRLMLNSPISKALGQREAVSAPQEMQ